ncbi:MAG TPA: hypothetical protein VFT45_13240 [Longimicrobium sp.]|nr:hypothetical protein [Longimicrobium sp.]
MRDAALSRATAGVPLERLGVVSYDRAGVLAFSLVYVGTALGAYALGPFPVQWLTQFFLLGVAGLLAMENRLPAVPGAGVLAVLLGWAGVVTFGRLMTFPYGVWMPAGATAPYPVYIALRFLGLLTFAASACLVYWLLREGHRETLLRRIVWTGSLGAAAAVYIYFAQVNGWWEPSRTRMGTGGGEQSIEFAYAFHRALGTFREPSHLAEWLVLPLFASFTYRGRGRHLHTGVMAVALLLTGSLTGLAGIFLGLLGALLLSNPFRAGAMKLTVRLGAAVAVAMALFGFVAVGYRGKSANLLQVLTDRVVPLMEGGLGQSNRSYVLEYVMSRPIPFVGEGIGNSNIVFANALGSPVTASFISLYFNTLMSLGVVGLGLVLGLLALPVVRMARQRRYRTDPELMPLMAAYLGWLVMFGVHSEELGLVFGIVYALLAWEAAGRPLARPAAAGVPG